MTNELLIAIDGLKAQLAKQAVEIKWLTEAKDKFWKLLKTNKAQGQRLDAEIDAMQPVVEAAEACELAYTSGGSAMRSQALGVVFDRVRAYRKGKT